MDPSKLKVFQQVERENSYEIKEHINQKMYDVYKEIFVRTEEGAEKVSYSRYLMPGLLPSGEIKRLLNSKNLFFKGKALKDHKILRDRDSICEFKHPLDAFSKGSKVYVSGKLYECEFCHAGWAKFDSLVKHIEKKIAKHKEDGCEICRRTNYTNCYEGKCLVGTGLQRQNEDINQLARRIISMFEIPVKGWGKRDSARPITTGTLMAEKELHSRRKRRRKEYGTEEVKPALKSFLEGHIRMPKTVRDENLTRNEEDPSSDEEDLAPVAPFRMPRCMEEEPEEEQTQEKRERKEKFAEILKDETLRHLTILDERSEKFLRMFRTDLITRSGKYTAVQARIPKKLAKDIEDENVTHYDQNYMVKTSHNLPLVLRNYWYPYERQKLEEKGKPFSFMDYLEFGDTEKRVTPSSPSDFIRETKLKGSIESNLIQAWIALIKFIMKKSATRINDYPTEEASRKHQKALVFVKKNVKREDLLNKAQLRCTVESKKHDTPPFKSVLQSYIKSDEALNDRKGVISLASEIAEGQ